MTISTEKLSLEQQLLQDYFRNEDIYIKNFPGFVGKLRKESVNKFLKTGIPLQGNEEWRFTPIRKKIADCGKLYPFLNQPEEINKPVEEVFRCSITELDTYDTALINGWFPHTLNASMTLDEGVKLSSIQNAFNEYPELMEQYLGKIAPDDSGPFSALNDVYFQDGLFIYFPEGTHSEKAIQIIEIITGAAKSFFTPFVHFRILVVMGAHSRGKIVICDHTLTPDTSFSTSVVEIVAEKNAELEIVRVQNQNDNAIQVSGLYAKQLEGSKIHSSTITLNGGFLRNNQIIDLNEPHAEVYMSGAYLADRQQHIDNHTFIRHNAPECHSDELFKGILDDSAHCVFKGLIKVEKDAQLTQSYQKNNNLLLTDKAVINTLPQLEIYADDVKCSHGATVGYLNEEEMFYLVSRGINKKEARLMLMNAFVSEIIQKISVKELRDRIALLVNQRIRGQLTYCTSCVLRCQEL